MKNSLRLPLLVSIVSGLVIVFLFYLLFSGETYRFYASFVFFFYSLTKSMWISVILLGVFQTILLIPLRVVNLRLALRVEEFEERLGETKMENQLLILKKHIREGNLMILWSIINFLIQTISYLSIGRLFLTNFYTRALNHRLLYSFVPYPQYPIRDIFFKIPYPVITKTIDFGMDKVLILALIIIIYKIFSGRLLSFYQRQIKSNFLDQEEEKFPFSFFRQIAKFFDSASILLLLLGWLIIRHFPVGWEVRIFSGDVSRRNYTLNFITAVCAFFVIIWLDLPKIRKKVQIARLKNIPKKIISQTQKELWENSFRNAFVIGLGAYFITNQIPSAFELSIFTFEVISFLSPFTLDRVILKTKIVIKKPENRQLNLNFSKEITAEADKERSN